MLIKRGVHLPKTSKTLVAFFAKFDVKHLPKLVLKLQILCAQKHIDVL
jgi:hypothetical protein